MYCTWRLLALATKVDGHVIAYMVCLQEVRKGIEAVAPGASIMQRMEPQQVASVAQMLLKQLADKESPLLAGAKMQVMNPFHAWSCMHVDVGAHQHTDRGAHAVEPRHAACYSHCNLSHDGMQAMMEVAFKAQREVVEKEQAERAERVAMLGRGTVYLCIDCTLCCAVLRQA